jgi:hypothetical protein
MQRPMDERVLCPVCGESIPGFARRCRHCGELLDASVPDPDVGPRLLLSFGCGVVLLATLCVTGSIVASAALPNIVRAQKLKSERGAVSTLRAIAAAEARFRDEDADGDGKHDYGDLGELGMCQLLDPLVVSGIKDGYEFEVAASRTAPEERFIATATPTVPGTTGDRSFAVNHAGQVYSRASRPFLFDLDKCAMPGDATPLLDVQ